MKSNVNPFEPWRPTEASIPPPIHAARPWRPPPPPPAQTATAEAPFVEPVNPPPRKKTCKRRPRPDRPQAQTSQGRTPVSQLTVFVVLGVLTILGLSATGWLSGTHILRLMTLGGSSGLFVGMAFNRRGSWRTRLTWMAFALALAGLGLWFVPTLRGVNLWSAYRQVEAVRALTAGDVAAYQRGAPARRSLLEEFPSFAPELRAAEQAWLRRTVDEAIENADRQLETDPHAALANLHRLNTALTPLEHYASVQKDLESARARAMQACARVVRREAEDLLGQK